MRGDFIVFIYRDTWYYFDITLTEISKVIKVAEET